MKYVCAPILVALFCFTLGACETPQTEAELIKFNYIVFNPDPTEWTQRNSRVQYDACFDLCASDTFGGQCKYVTWGPRRPNGFTQPDGSRSPDLGTCEMMERPLSAVYNSGNVIVAVGGPSLPEYTSACRLNVPAIAADIPDPISAAATCIDDSPDGLGQAELPCQEVTSDIPAQEFIVTLDASSGQLLPDSADRLRSAARKFSGTCPVCKSDRLVVTITGLDTDDSYNTVLQQQRANGIAERLATYGIDSSMIRDRRVPEARGLEDVTTMFAVRVACAAE